eukprot:CAMPEP_0202442228 /NCGR_PEP_ID=MMETSP1360-20130828/1688_1 /ASSEMBLY_ACC=CAM_ASM_000848 /TAXON_ID=515479 /ORGANISM="Licmophora paradoxa, Strain CCMP2313" /LENGTH=307 /DNA_ID=CAMNT_0049057535 /DNA_START=32 /DNA_END=955 /DNA_ORIENTATION=+
MQSIKSTFRLQHNVAGRFFSSGAPNGRLILVSHGPSEWQKGDQSNTSVNRFTGWVNVPLAEKGRDRAHEIGNLLQSTYIDCAVTSQLGRARDTLDIILDNMGDTRDEIPVVETWRLNERHFGSLVGLSRVEAERIYGKETIDSFRHNYEAAPPPMDKNTVAKWERQNHCKLVTSQKQDRDEKILEIGRSWCNSTEKMPLTESMKDCNRRMMPFWEKALEPRLKNGETVLVVSHNSILKVMLQNLDPVLKKDSFSQLKVPCAVPIMYTFDSEMNVIPEENTVGEGICRELQGKWIDEPIVDDEEVDIA